MGTKTAATAHRDVNCNNYYTFTAAANRGIIKNRNNNGGDNSMNKETKKTKSVRFGHNNTDDDGEVNVTIHVLPPPPRGHEDRFQLLASLLQQRQNKKLLWWTDEELRAIWKRSFEELDSIMKTMKQEDQDDPKKELKNGSVGRNDHDDEAASTSSTSSNETYSDYHYWNSSSTILFHKMIKFSFFNTSWNNTHSSSEGSNKLTARGLERFYQDTEDVYLKTKRTKQSIQCILQLQQHQAKEVKTIQPSSCRYYKKQFKYYKKLCKQSRKRALEYGKLDAKVVQDYLKTTHEELLREQQQQQRQRQEVQQPDK